MWVVGIVISKRWCVWISKIKVHIRNYILIYLNTFPHFDCYIHKFVLACICVWDSDFVCIWICENLLCESTHESHNTHIQMRAIKCGRVILHAYEWFCVCAWVAEILFVIVKRKENEKKWLGIFLFIEQFFLLFKERKRNKKKKK